MNIKNFFVGFVLVILVGLIPIISFLIELFFLPHDLRKGQELYETKIYPLGNNILLENNKIISHYTSIGQLETGSDKNVLVGFLPYLGNKLRIEYPSGENFFSEEYLISNPYGIRKNWLTNTTFLIPLEFSGNYELSEYKNLEGFKNKIPFKLLVDDKASDNVDFKKVCKFIGINFCGKIKGRIYLVFVNYNFDDTQLQPVKFEY